MVENKKMLGSANAFNFILLYISLGRTASNQAKFAGHYSEYNPASVN